MNVCKVPVSVMGQLLFMLFPHWWTEDEAEALYTADPVGVEATGANPRAVHGVIPDSVLRGVDDLTNNGVPAPELSWVSSNKAESAVTSTKETAESNEHA